MNIHTHTRNTKWNTQTSKPRNVKPSLVWPAELLKCLNKFTSTAKRHGTQAYHSTTHILPLLHSQSWPIDRKRFRAHHWKARRELYKKNNNMEWLDGTQFLPATRPKWKLPRQHQNRRLFYQTSFFFIRQCADRRPADRHIFQCNPAPGNIIV